MDTGNDYIDPRNKNIKNKYIFMQGVKYAAGQPMGALSS